MPPTPGWPTTRSAAPWSCRSCWCWSGSRELPGPPCPGSGWRRSATYACCAASACHASMPRPETFRVLCRALPAEGTVEPRAAGRGRHPPLLGHRRADRGRGAGPRRGRSAPAAPVGRPARLRRRPVPRAGPAGAGARRRRVPGRPERRPHRPCRQGAGRAGRGGPTPPPSTGLSSWRCCGPSTSSAVASLPTRVAAVRLWADGPLGQLRGIVSGRSAEGQRAVCDVALIAADGRLAAELHGVETHLLPGD